jgi:hypothetical protein
MEMPSISARAPGRFGGPFVVVLVLLTLVAAACGGGSSKSSSTTVPKTAGTSGTATTPENTAFYYLPITTPAQMQKLGPVRLVVAGPQNAGGSGAAAVAAIHSVGAKAYIYQQTYWAPLHREYQGFRLGSNEDWAFCSDGQKPLEVPKGSNGEQWVFIDMNERAVQQYLTDRFQKLKAAGWDGVFFDRGGVALAGYGQNPAIWNKQSTCTQNPVHPGAVFADTWIDASGLVKAAGMDLIVNYGHSPFDPRVPMRPDPHNPKCDQQGPQCPTLEDGWKYPTWVADESVAHPRDIDWDLDFQSNLMNEQDPAHGGRVLGLITVGTLANDLSRENVFFEWARVKLFNIPLAISVWDRAKACPGVPASQPCNNLITYPELSGVQLGSPIDAKPQSASCASSGPPHCVWTRRYAQGAMIANVQDRSVGSYKLVLGTDGCRYVRDVWSGAAMAGNKCVQDVTLDLPAWSGRPLAYSKTPLSS